MAATNFKQMKKVNFRAWDGEKFHYYTSLSGLYGVLYPIEQQFTGLRDKIGKEIYDGDILKVGKKHGFNSELLTEFEQENTLPSINGIGLHFVGIVRIDLLRGLMFENPQNGYQEPMFTRHRNIKWNHSDIEIIGNIYENPELL